MGFRGSDSQLSLTPFQRQVIDAERVRRSKQKQEQREEMMNQGQGGQQSQPPMNSRAGGSGGNTNKQSETVRYVNESENPDFIPPEQ